MDCGESMPVWLDQEPRAVSLAISLILSACVAGQSDAIQESSPAKLPAGLERLEKLYREYAAACEIHRDTAKKQKLALQKDIASENIPADGYLVPR
jgi:hypothetical protein